MNEPIRQDLTSQGATGADDEAMERAAQAAEKAEAESRLRSGASWFYWVAGLSLVNSVISLAEGGWSFLFGLGATQILDAVALAVAEQSGGSGMAVRAVAFVVSLLIAGLFGLFGWLAGRRRLWAFWVGGLLYLGDALLLVLLEDWLGLAFHGWVLFSLTRGYLAGRKLAALDPAPESANDPFAPPETDFQGPG